MFWTFSFQLMPGEELVEGSESGGKGGLKPDYSILLTDKRAVFRFESLGSNLTQSFPYEEIEEAEPRKRAFVHYLRLKTFRREFFFHVPDPAYWGGRIVELRDRGATTIRHPAESPGEGPAPEPTPADRSELLGMLDRLRDAGVLSQQEWEQKRILVAGGEQPGS